MEPNKSWHNVGQRIRFLRKTHGLTLRQLALGCDLSANAISLIERGEVAPTVATLCKIANALGSSASSFLQEICPGDAVLLRAHSDDEGEPIQKLAGTVIADSSCADIAGSLCRVQGPKPAGKRQYSLCLSGQIEFEDSESQSHLLYAGDRLLYNSNAFQRWQNSSSETAIVILVFPGQK